MFRYIWNRNSFKGQNFINFHSDALRLRQQNFPVSSLSRSIVIIQIQSHHECFNGTCILFIAKGLHLFPCQHTESPQALWRWRAPAIEGVIYGDGRNGNKDEPRGSTGALCAPYWVPLDVTGDKLCEGQKQTTQQKQADVDKRRRTGLMIGELWEFSGKMPPRFLVEPSGPIRPGDGLL